MTVMTKIENLIDELVSDASPRKAMSLTHGWILVASVALFMTLSIILSLAMRADLREFSFTMPLVWKLMTTSALALSLTHLVIKSSQPQYRIYAVRLIPAGLALAVFFMPALIEWIAGGMPNPALSSFGKCFLTIAGLGLIQLAVVLLWVRNGAPTHPATTGYLTGAAAGAWASFAYSMHCTHDEMFYAGTWYSAATIALSLFGGLIAPRFCKW
jgi:hypothetical protein